MSVFHTMVHAVSSVFKCQHDRLTRPFTIRKQSYMVCLDCGHQVFYSMEEMRRLSRREVRQLRNNLAEITVQTASAPGDPVEDTILAA